MQTIQDQAAIDEIIYLASLASEPKAISPLMDYVRAITARMQIGEKPTAEDRSQLHQVRHELESYLETQDPLRTLSADTIAIKLRDHTSSAASSTPWRKTQHPIVRILTLSLVGYLLAFLLIPGHVSVLSRVMLAVPGFIVPLHCGIIWLFWSALTDFRPELRRAYLYICLGVFLTLIGALQFPFLFALPELSNIPLFRYGGFLPFFTAMCILFYVGMRAFAQLLHISAWFTSLRIVLPLAAIVSLGIVFLPHGAAVAEEGFYDLSVLSFSFCVLCSIPSFLIARAITRTITTRYAPAMEWFGITQIVIAVASAIFAAAIYLRGPTGGVTLSLVASPFICSEMLLLVSGYIFKKNLTTD